MRGGSLLLFFALVLIVSPPLRTDRGRLSRLLFFPLFLFFYLFFVLSDGMEREARVCDHGFERSDLCAEIIIIIIITGRPRYRVLPVPLCCPRYLCAL